MVSLVSSVSLIVMSKLTIWAWTVGSVKNQSKIDKKQKQRKDEDKDE